MTRPRIYTTNAEKQKAFRQRRKAEIAQLEQSAQDKAIADLKAEIANLKAEITLLRHRQLTVSERQLMVRGGA